ncbi:hypothetical protein CPB97_009575 [Podila verticillata]|nr:hypothetical protein CPB97_009575 [Podila verticillata]
MQRDIVPLVILNDERTPDRDEPVDSGARIKVNSPPLTSGILVQSDDSLAEDFDCTLFFCWAAGQRDERFWGKVVKFHKVAFNIVVKKRACNSFDDVDTMTAKHRGSRNLQGGTCGKKEYAPEKLGIVIG